MNDIKGQMGQMQADLKNTDEKRVKVGQKVSEVNKKIEKVQKQIKELLHKPLEN